MITICRVLAGFTLLLLALAPIPGWAAAPSPAAEGKQTLVSAEIIKAKSEETVKAAEIDADTKAKLLELYNKSQDNLAQAAASEALEKKYLQAIETAPREIATITAQLGKMAPPQAASESPLPLRELEQLLLTAKAQASAVEADAQSLNSQFALQNERPIKAGQRLAEARENEGKLVTASKETTLVAESPQLAEARRWMQETHNLALRSEIRMLGQEMVSMPVVMELIGAQKEEATRRLEQARSQVQRLETQVNSKRQEEAARNIGQAQEAIRQVEASAPVLREAARFNAELSDGLQTITNALEQATQEKDQVEKQLKKLDEQFKSARQKVELAGLSHALGLIMHEQRRMLPQAGPLRKKIGEAAVLAADSGLMQLQYMEERTKLGNLDALLAEQLADFAPAQRAEVAPPPTGAADRPANAGGQGHCLQSSLSRGAGRVGTDLRQSGQNDRHLR